MRRILLLSWSLLITPALAAAQATTADGVQAMLRGDYDTAVGILRPLADAPSPDPTAQFFMAIAYESGLGVASLNVRSCRYYLSGAVPANPFMTASAELGELLRQMLPPAAVQFCLDPFPSPDVAANSAAAPPADVAPATARGVEAILRGDVVRGFNILQPIAESATSDDHVAQFFLGMLYQDGRAVPHDPLRACGLFFRASSFPGRGLFVQQAASLTRRYFMTRGQQAFAECQRLGNAGFDDHDLQRVTFTLAPGHTISIDAQGAVVVYNGRNTQIQLPFVTRGTRFLPPRHTELETRHPMLAHRHFVDLLAWTPLRDGRWSLRWHVIEVVRDVLSFVVNQELVTVDDPDVWTATNGDPRALVSLGVDRYGNAEWASPGSHPGRGGIASAEERAEEQQRSRERALADARVDWSAVRELGRPPSLGYVGAAGCYGATIYGWSDDRTEAISVTAADGALKQSGTVRSFDLGIERGVTVVVHLFARPMREWPYCSDVRILPDPAEQQWRAVAGTITVRTGPPGVRASAPGMYDATVTISGAEFMDDSGARIRPRQDITLNAISVGFSER